MKFILSSFFLYIYLVNYGYLVGSHAIDKKKEFYGLQSFYVKVVFAESLQCKTHAHVLNPKR